MCNIQPLYHHYNTLQQYPVQSTWIPTAPLNYVLIEPPRIPQESPRYSNTFRNGKRILLNRNRNRNVCLVPAHPRFYGREHNFISDVSFSSNVEDPVQWTWIPTAPLLNYISIPQEPPRYSSTFRNGKRILLNRNRNRNVCLVPAHPRFYGREHNFISDVSFSSNGKYAASNVEDPVQWTWIPTAPLLNYISIPQEPPRYSSTFRNEKRILLNRNRNRNVCLVPAHPRFYGREHNFISDVSFSSNGKYAASNVEDFQLEDKKRQIIVSGLTSDCWYNLLKEHILSPEDLKKRGYPIESLHHPGCAIINYTPYPTKNNFAFCFVNTNINDNNKEKKTESGNHSSEHERKNAESAEKYDCSSQQQRIKCARCHKPLSININTGKLYKQKCRFHSGKLFDGRTNGVINRNYWTCCNGKENAIGCEVGVHVSIGLTPGLNGPLKGYVRTLPLNHCNNKYRICALDCEMCYTEHGFELTKITVIDLEGKIVCNDFVKPNSEILDYNTRFSGVTEEHIKQKSTLTLQQVQKKLLNMISAETIIIGHNVASDLRALRIIHSKVVDTTVLIPDPRGYPYAFGLKALTQRLLQRNIQKNTHNSFEDAQAALDLALHYISKKK